MTLDWAEAPPDRLVSTFDWRDSALCAQTDPELFFPEKGQPSREAKTVCKGCTVREKCLREALVNDEQWGIWGGLSTYERRKLRRTGTHPILATLPPRRLGGVDRSSENSWRTRYKYAGVTWENHFSTPAAAYAYLAAERVLIGAGEWTPPNKRTKNNEITADSAQAAADAA